MSWKSSPPHVLVERVAGRTLHSTNELTSSAGKIGDSSAAARFAAATDSNFQIEKEKPYAEVSSRSRLTTASELNARGFAGKVIVLTSIQLWMGTHPSNPSTDLTTGRSLLDRIADNEQLMGSHISKKYEKRLPFLFKVLSIAKALSIQAHPNKGLAEQLHSRDPEHYPDDNHKPEMTIAITPFEGLCGFRPLQEIKHFLDKVPTLRQLVGEQNVKDFEMSIGNEAPSPKDEKAKKALQTAFTALMNSKPDDIKAAAPKLVDQAKEEGSNFADGALSAELISRLNNQFPADLGLFVTFFLNYVHLQPGEAMFLRADDIHAYISGDIIECMASSDNVVRAGFTPKFKDVDTLTTMLTYNFAPSDEQKLEPVDWPHAKFNADAGKSGSECKLYDPPIEEFCVLRTVLGSDGSKITFDPVEGPSIIICTQGKGKISVGPKKEEIKTGWVYFVGATAEVVLESVGSEEMVSFRAFCELEEAATNGDSGANL